MLDNIYMLNLHAYIKNSARIIDEVCQAASKWPEIARENEVLQKMIEEIQSNMVFF